MEIRLSYSKDLNRIIEIYNQAIATRVSTADIQPVSKADRRTWFDNHTPNSYPIYVADLEGKIAGWCSLSPYRPGRMAVRHTAEISYYIDNQFKRMGIGTRLIKHAMQDCTRINIKHLFGILLESNVPSEKLLLKLGFERWGRMPGVAEIDGKNYSHIYLGKRVQS